MSCSSVLPMTNPAGWAFAWSSRRLRTIHVSHPFRIPVPRSGRAGHTYLVCRGSVGGVMGTNTVTAVGSVVSNDQARQIIDDPLVTLTLAAPLREWTTGSCSSATTTRAGPGDHCCGSPGVLARDPRSRLAGEVPTALRPGEGGGAMDEEQYTYGPEVDLNHEEVRTATVIG